MPRFNYKAADSSGNSRTGSLDAEDRRSAARQLAAQGLRVLSLSTNEPGGASAPSTSSKKTDNAEASSVFSDAAPGAIPKKLKQRRLFGPHRTGWDFIDSFYQLHSSGLPMGDAVKLLGQRVSDPSLRYLCQSLWRDMSEGATMAGAMSRFPVVFDPASIYLIEAGESTGNLIPVLRKVLDSYNLREELRTKVLSSIGYPIGVCSMAAAVLALFVFYLIPRLEQMMKSLKGEFSLPVKMMMWLSDFLIKGGPFIIVALLIILWAIVQWRKSENGRMTTDNWLLHLPLIGAVVRHTETVRMADLLATLMGSGINSTDALRLSERPVENRILRGRLSAGRQMINDGAAFASAFKRHSILPINDLGILAVGENTGSLSDTFQTIANRHVKALDKAIQRLLRIVTATALGTTVTLVFICMISIVMTVLSVSQNVLKH
ncbi:MAG: type II secretion system F family protein [Puniceicoccales bacterium]|jgi:type II secretory pathway component PulF|nr:type II secretion system F family protein [Puniceicoccales bacterium]